FRRASFMRVCQPSPAALNLASTSRSIRSVTCSFVPEPAGRPRRARRSASACSTAPSVASKSSGSLGSALRLIVDACFTIVAPPDGDEPKPLATHDVDGGSELRFHHADHLEAIL